MFKKVYIHTPLQTSTLEDEKAFIATVSRKKLGQWMKRKAEKLGVKILTNEVVNIRKKENKVILKSNKKIGYNYLIGADGSASIVRRKLKIKKEKVGAAYQYLVKKIYPKMELFIDIARFGHWYVWIFPHKNYTSIGTWCNPEDFPIKKNKKNFEKWLKEKKVDLKGAKYEAWVINYDYQGFEFNNIFLVGDAGGFASGLTGEGMYFAMISGTEAAKKILKPDYNLPELKKILKIKKLHEQLLDALDFSGPLSKIEVEIAELVIKTKVFDGKIIEAFL